jgi:hypothetical protein
MILMKSRKGGFSNYDLWFVGSGSGSSPLALFKSSGNVNLWNVCGPLAFPTC